MSWFEWRLGLKDIVLGLAYTALLDKCFPTRPGVQLNFDFMSDFQPLF